jgi:hypothetical protein
MSEEDQTKKSGQHHAPEDMAKAAKMVLRRNLLNISKKVADGGTLTSFELAQLHEIAGEGGEKPTPGMAPARAWAKNQVELAECIGRDRKTIQRWRKEHADFPRAESDGRWNVVAVKQWMDKTGRADEEDDEDKTTLEVRRLRSICDRLDFDFAVIRGEYTKNADIAQMVGEMITDAKTELLSIPTQAAPMVVGLGVPEVESILRKFIDDALIHLYNGQQQLTPEDAAEEGDEEDDSGEGP